MESGLGSGSAWLTWHAPAWLGAVMGPAPNGVAGATIALVALFLPGFLILIGALLVAEGLGQHIDKGYIYFAMAFAMVIEMINMRMRKKREKPIQLHGLGEEAVEDGLMKKL